MCMLLISHEGPEVAGRAAAEGRVQPTVYARSSYYNSFVVTVVVVTRVSAAVTFGRGDLSVCPLGVSIGAHGCLISTWRCVPQGSPQGQTLRALLLRVSSMPH